MGCDGQLASEGNCPSGGKNVCRMSMRNFHREMPGGSLSGEIFQRGICPRKMPREIYPGDNSCRPAKAIVQPDELKLYTLAVLQY